MCGIVGAAGWIGDKEKKAVKQMLVVDTLRGEHSTGLLSLSSFGDLDNTKVAKLAANAIDFLEWGPAKTILNLSSSLLIGHNRYATKGAVNNLNAHPFDFDNVAGVHNGTLVTRSGLLDSHLFEVDSENLYHTLNQKPLSEIYPKLDGALALAYYDKQAGDLNLIRNDERPLFYTFSEDRKTVFWASEKWMLIGILGRNYINHKKIITCEPHKLYSFKVPRSATQATSQAFDNIRIRTLEKPPAKTTSLTVINGGNKKNTGETTGGATYNGPTTAELLKYRGQRMEFFVIGLEKRHCQSYLSCSLMEDERVEVRIYMNENSKEFREMDASTAIYEGLVERVYAYGIEPHLVMLVHTIHDTGEDLLDSNPFEEEPKYKGKDGKMLTEDEAKEALFTGCAWCDTIENVDNIEDVHWFGIGNQYICCDCKNNPDINQYITL